MSYILVKYIDKPGYVNAYHPIQVSEDLNEIKEAIKKRVIDGSPVRYYKIVQEIPFEFKCAIQMKEGT